MTVLSNSSSCKESVQLDIIVWPKRDDMDTVHLSNIFAVPITVPHFISGPFEIPEQPAVEKLFRVIRKHTRV